MIGRRVTITLSLLIALLCVALVAQSASAVQGTTAFTCVKGGFTKDFQDAHCDNSSSPGEGSFGHTEIGEGKTTELELTNAKTKNSTTESTMAVFVLKGLMGGQLEVGCTTVSGTSSNVNIAKGMDGVMANEGKAVKVSFKTCQVLAPEAYKECDVAEPLEFTGTSTTRVGLGLGKNTMGVEFKPALDKEGKSLPLVELTFTAKPKGKCSLAGNTIPIKGTILGTGSRGSDESVGSSGGTLQFTRAMTTETLTWGGFQAALEGTITTSVSGGGNPIALTTTAS